MAKQFTAGGFFLLLLLMVACSESNSVQTPAIAVPEGLLKRAEEIDQGLALFIRHCRECHGTVQEGRTQRAGKFKPPAPDFLNDQYAQADPAYLYRRISLGKTVEPFYSQGSVMPAFGLYFSEQQIWQLVAYIKERAVNTRRQR